jgi:hypothetical protein
MTRATILLIASAAFCCGGASAQVEKVPDETSDLPPEVILLARIRSRATADFSHLPNFTCLETIRRFRGYATKPLKRVDTVQIEVANAGRGEMYAWPGERNFEQRPLFDMIGAGLVTEGEYIVHAKNILVAGAGRVRYGAMEDIRGRKAARYDFEVPAAFSGNHLTLGPNTAVIGERGSFWADTSNYDLLRLAFAGIEIPEELGIRSTSTQIDYGRVRIGAENALLPQTAVSSMTRANGEVTQNHIEFSGCREFTAESVVSFGPPSDKPRASGAANELILPVGYDMHLRLTAPVRLTDADVGSPIQAELDSDFKVDGRVIAPKGAVVSGRLRVMQQQDGVYMAGMEWTDLAFGDNHARFISTLASADDAYVTRERRVSGRSGDSQVVEIPPAIEDVTTVFTRPGVKELPRGMRITLKIVGIGN